MGVFRRPCGEVRRGTVSPDAFVRCGEVVPAWARGRRGCRRPAPARSGAWQPCCRASPRGVEAGGARAENGSASLRRPVFPPGSFARAPPGVPLNPSLSREPGRPRPTRRRVVCARRGPSPFAVCSNLDCVTRVPTSSPGHLVIYSARFTSGPLYFRCSFRFGSVQSLSRVRLSATP